MWTDKNLGTEAKEKERVQDFEEKREMDDEDEDSNAELEVDMEVEKMMEGEIERLATQVQPIHLMLSKVSTDL